jgi:hypothetical protein
MKKNQKPKVVTVDWTWDSDKHDDLMRSIKEIMDGKFVPPPLSRPKPQRGTP